MRTWIHRVSAFALFGLCAAGCSTVGESLGLSPPANPLLDTTKMVRDSAPVPAPVPRELAKELLPTHLVEPGDTLLVQPVELDAPVRLPPDQPVEPDGTIDLGIYGRPVVVGKTVAQVETQVQEIVAAREKQKVPLTVRLIARPGMVYYVFGEVNAPGSFPISGRETVIDAVVAAGGLTRRASPGNMVLSRPTPPDGCRLVYPVCFENIVQLGDTTTNYQLQPGDRIFVPSKSMLENLLPARCRKPTPACARPQVSCFGGVGGCQPAVAPAALPGVTP